MKSRPELEPEDVNVENIQRKTDTSVEQEKSVVIEKLGNIDDKPSTSKSFDNDLHECMCSGKCQLGMSLGQAQQFARLKDL